jgi:DNA ligase (NAD+)
LRVLHALGVRGTRRRCPPHRPPFRQHDNVRAAETDAMRQVEGTGTEEASSIVTELT